MKHRDWFLKFLNTVAKRCGLLQVVENTLIKYLYAIKRLNAFKEIFQKIFFLKYDHTSSNINEVIKAILDFFIQKFHKHKKYKALASEQIKNAPKKHLRGK